MRKGCSSTDGAPNKFALRARLGWRNHMPGRCTPFIPALRVFHDETAMHQSVFIKWGHNTHDEFGRAMPTRRGWAKLNNLLATHGEAK